MWLEITPRDTENVKMLRSVLEGAGDDYLTFKADEPEYHSYEAYDVTHEWGVTITGEKSLCDENSITLHLSTETVEYYTVNYSSWLALAELSEDFTIMGRDVVVRDDGSVDLKATMRNSFNH